MKEQVERWETWLHGRGIDRVNYGGLDMEGQGRDPHVAACLHCTKVAVTVFELANGNSSPMVDGFIELQDNNSTSRLGNYEKLMKSRSMVLL